MLVAVGPVQDFINEARKTRDLWFGSYVLSEISKAVAYTFKQEGAELIFPAFEVKTEDAELNSTALPEILKQLEPDSKLAVSNKIALLVPEGKEPQAFAKLAKEAATEAWERYANTVLEKVEIKKNINMEIWEKQIKKIVECYVVWVPFEEDKYGETWERAELLMAGRKALRNFGYQEKEQEQNGEQKSNDEKYPEEGISKSSLSGARESVLSPNVNRKLLSLNEKEHLDAIGLVKRLSMRKRPGENKNNPDNTKVDADNTKADSENTNGTKESFPSVSRIAIDPWLRGVQKAGNELDQIKDIFEREEVFQLDIGEYKNFSFFPYDTEILLTSRIDQYKGEFADSNNWEIIKNQLRSLWNKYGEPNPYLAILMADGDWMGAAISNLKSLEEHQNFSRQLSQFALQAKEIVVKDGNGALVFSGGDDVFAFLPVDKCLMVARKLHVTFGETMSKFKGKDDKNLTLSVGILLAHCLEPLEDLRRMAKEAESDAKSTDRNGLAIHFISRSGGDAVKIRKQWNDGVTQNNAKEADKEQDKENIAREALDKRIMKWVGLLLELNISAQTAYDLRQLYLDYAGWPTDGKVESFEELLKEDTSRILEKKKPRGGELPTTVADLLQGIKKPKDLLELSNELILASALAKSMRQADPVKYRSVKEGVL